MLVIDICNTIWVGQDCGQRHLWRRSECLETEQGSISIIGLVEAAVCGLGQRRTVFVQDGVEPEAAAPASRAKTEDAVGTRAAAGMAGTAEPV